MMIFRKVHLRLNGPEGLHVYWTADFSPQAIRISSGLKSNAFKDW